VRGFIPTPAATLGADPGLALLTSQPNKLAVDEVAKPEFRSLLIYPRWIYSRSRLAAV